MERPRLFWSSVGILSAVWMISITSPPLGPWLGMALLLVLPFVLFAWDVSTANKVPPPELQEDGDALQTPLTLRGLRHSLLLCPVGVAMAVAQLALVVHPWALTALLAPMLVAGGLWARRRQTVMLRFDAHELAIGDRSEPRGDVVRVDLDGDRLAVRLTGGRTWHLRPVNHPIALKVLARTLTEQLIGRSIDDGDHARLDSQKTMRAVKRPTG